MMMMMIKPRNLSEVDSPLCQHGGSLRLGLVTLQPGLCGKCPVQSVTQSPQKNSPRLRLAPALSPGTTSFVDPNYFPFTSSDVLFMLFQCGFTFDKGMEFPHLTVNMVRKSF